ncbi:MAG: diguanylate cyclase [Treponema sp.]|nr:diguanylate cyclase [Treponema sp.]
MTSEDIDINLIQKTELFSSLTHDEINFVVSRCGTLKLSKGSLLFSPDEEAKHFYILKQGAVRVYKSRSDGGKNEMAHFAPGDTIGDFDFARGAEYDAFAEAAEDSVLIEFPGYGHTIDSLRKEQPHAACSILLHAIALTTKRIKTTNKLILENMSWVQELHRRAYEDAGTGLWKQTLMDDEIIKALNKPSALIMLKPDHFKILVDSRGHAVGDEAMVKIALILKNMTRKTGHGWALRFKSNETGLIISGCGSKQAHGIAEELAKEIASMEPVPAEGENSEFKFSATISWTIWPEDEDNWEKIFQGNYAFLLDNWKAGGGKTVRYRKQGNNGK